uniref:RNA 2',3'-cyclic phosphodiesterase n=1 Tax=Candidatus Kentrum sp. TC TaxID=2126339 RepID=A0A451AAZ9_9GAMM|nr:MAG: 2'-5' RNA ligase [Candidatus Kentron sp. TC]VFK63204.1 MAG: 2'-5' RNA ligase [Candidatus Kentron sp. TC]
MNSSPNTPEPTRRLFFALWPTEPIRQALAEIARSVVCRGNPVSARNFHVTLAFLGPVDARRRDCMERMAAEVEAEPFVLRLNRMGCFSRAGIAWSGASRTPQGLISLVEGLHGRLAECGFIPEKRPFTPHVTLFRKARVESGSHKAVEWAVDGFCLVESSTLPTGARYRVLRRWPLRDDP